MRKIFLLLIILNMLNGCSFTPLHSNKTNTNFSIEEIAYEGDKIINNFFKIYFKILENNEHEKKYKISVTTEYYKNVLSRDSTAEILDYQLSAKVLFKISLNDKLIKEIKFVEKQNTNSISDKFEEQKYERVIKENFASTIFNKLISELSKLNDY